MRIFLILIALVVALLLLRTSFFTVDRTEFVYVTQFGRHVATYDGADDSQAGLHLKWPFQIQSVRTFDRRLQHFDLAGAELLTRDKERNSIDQTLILDAYVCWRIADPDRFLRSVQTPERARDLLSQRISHELGAAVGELKVADLVSLEPGNVGPDGARGLKADDTREFLRQRLLSGGAQPLQATAREQYGIEIVDIRLRRISHPARVRQGIFERIISERKKKAAEYESEGEQSASQILSASNRRVQKLKARAQAEAVRLGGQADARADQIRGDAMAQDPEFYGFLRKLEAYRSILNDGKTTLLLSTQGELFRTLFDPPGPRPESKTPPAIKEGGK
jgi:membrane protease subunit HflC